MDKSILYVDVENLQEAAKQILTWAIEHWPPDFPPPGTVKLYVKADQMELWKIWASHTLPSVEVQCKGVQHYTTSGSKNSADLALALDALADLLKQKTRYAAVMSDDSDYVTLFAAIKREMCSADNQIPLFKWFMTDRPDTRSQMLTDFFPSAYIHVVPGSPAINSKTDSKKIAGEEKKKISVAVRPFVDAENIAKVIIQKLPGGYFRSANCKNIIKQYFPNHELNGVDSAAFGTQFLKYIWPVLEKYGVTSAKTSSGPRKYELTQEVKNAVG